MVKRRGDVFVACSRLLSQSRIPIRILIAIISAFHIAASATAEEANEDAKVRPNVLLILVDDLKPVAGCYETDPYETQNHAATQPEIVAKLKAILATYPEAITP
jgi:hypothetical protein